MADKAKNNLVKLKKRLSEELGKDDTDLGKVLELSNEIAQSDEENVRFSVDAGIVNRLGKELVARHETAVSELVKNAYDADATEVKLYFVDAWEEGGELRIEDDGLGMTREQLINGFMRLSSADKIHNPISTRYKRTRAGKKGIGRFATQRLGNSLTIITQTKKSKTALEVTINWDKFETDKDLPLIANKVEPVDKLIEEGTILIIRGLREGWSDAMIKRVYRYTSELLQPFPLSKKRKEQDKDRVDPGFRSAYYRVDDDEYPIIDEQIAFLNHALAEVEGYVLDDGQACWSLKSEKLDFNDVFQIGKDRDDNQSKYLFIKDVHFKVHYFLYDSSLLSPQTMKFIRSIARERGGVRVYRNGFRVLPYGEAQNDWLGLDESTAQRVILSSHRNINFFGFVEITDMSGVDFDETSSREGLFENEAYKELVDFVQRSILGAVIKTAELRGRKATTGQTNWEKEEEESPSNKVDQTISTLDNLVNSEDTGDEKNDKRSEEYRHVLQQLKDEREEEKQFFEEERKKYIDEINMLRILAGLGLAIGEFVHEVKRFLPAFDVDIRYLKKAVNEYKDALQKAERLDSNLKSFTTYTSYFDKAISQNVLRELVPLDLHEVVNDFEDVIANDIKRTKVVYNKPIFHDFDLVTMPMHPSEWASILFNLYTNAKKAIKRKLSEGNILIECGREEGIVYLEFSDDGDGIPKENEEKIFDAFFTTTSAASLGADDEDNLTGTGLGLKIIKDIIESYDGEIFVTTPKEGFSTTIRIEIPENG